MARKKKVEEEVIEAVIAEDVQTEWTPDPRDENIEVLDTVPGHYVDYVGPEGHFQIFVPGV